MTYLLAETAADSKRPRGARAARNSFTKAAKPCLSEVGPFSHST